MSNLSVAGRAALYSIQERKITVVDVSIEAMVASNEGKEGEGMRREERLYKYTVMNVLVGQTRSCVVEKGMM